MEEKNTIANHIEFSGYSVKVFKIFKFPRWFSYVNIFPNCPRCNMSAPLMYEIKACNILKTSISHLWSPLKGIPQQPLKFMIPPGEQRRIQLGEQPEGCSKVWSRARDLRLLPNLPNKRRNLWKWSPRSRELSSKGARWWSGSRSSPPGPERSRIFYPKPALRWSAQARPRDQRYATKTQLGIVQTPPPAPSAVPSSAPRLGKSARQGWSQLVRLDGGTHYS